jgi:hypothetical protein
MQAEESVRTRYGRLRTGVVFAALLLGIASAGGQQVTPPPIGFEYAVKFICGISPPAEGQPLVVARGFYLTAINVHNPGKEPVEFAKKFAIALPGEKAGRISPYAAAILKPDEALEIDCADIMRHLDAGGFVKGFAVLQSKVELDVVAVYTAAAAPNGTVAALETERVPARKY